MGTRGPKPGTRPSGRRKGAKNKRTLAREALTEHAIKGGISPLEFMLTIMREPIPAKTPPSVKLGLLTLKFDAAKSAAPYVHAKPAPSQGSRESAEEYARKIRETAAQLDDSVPAGPAQ
jgi:hypothetical protein